MFFWYLLLTYHHDETKSVSPYLTLLIGVVDTLAWLIALSTMFAPAARCAV